MLTTLIAIIAIVMAYMARNATADFKNQIKSLEIDIAALQQELGRLVHLVSRNASERGAAQTSTTAEQPSASAVTPALPMPPRPMAPREYPTLAQTTKPTSVPSTTRAAAKPGAWTSQVPASGESLEQALGARWAVWAGGLALALGGLFLVRYSIEAGLLGPGVRIILGLLLAAALVGTGEKFRRSEIDIPIESLPKAHIPSILTAAGTVVAFGSIYAAHALYGFIGPALAFIALGATGIAAMLAAALHGPALAGLGLAGSYIAPILVQSSAPNPWPVVLYLAVVAGAAYMLSRTRGWLWLAAAAVAGAVIWGLLLLDINIDSTLFGLPAIAIHTLAQLALAAVFLAIEPNAETKDARAEIDLIATASLAALSLLAILAIFAMPEEIATKAAFAILTMAILGYTAWRTAPAAAGLTFAGLIAVAVLLAWRNLNDPPPITLLAPWAENLLRLPDNVSSFLTFATFATLVPAAAAAYRIWSGALLRTPIAAIYALGATLPPLLALVVAYLRVTQFDISIPFAASAIALAAAFAIAAERFHRADIDYSSPAFNVAAGALAAAAIAAIAFALTAMLERGYLTVALALAALGTAYVATLRDIPLLRHAVTALGIVVLARVVWNPRIMGADVGATPIFNWLLVGYAVPAASFWGAARLLDKRGDSLSVRIADSLAVIFVWLLAFFEIRHLTNDGDILHAGSTFLEAGLLALTTLGLSFALARLNFAKSNPIFDIASIGLGTFSLGIAVLFLLMATNPLFLGGEVSGMPFVSTLLPAYLLPGLAALFVARHARGIRPDWYVRAAGILGVVLITTYVTLEVRHIFQGPFIGFWHTTTAPEHWAHSFAWLILGVAFLAYGLVRKSLEARIASAALIVLAATKITLFDLAGIGGFWRAFSFICLGAVLIGIGLVYQKIVFAPGGTKRPS